MTRIFWAKSIPWDIEIYIYIYTSVSVPYIERHTIRETAESQEASGTSVSFQEEFRCLHLAEQTRKKPCLAAKTTGTSSRQTFRYATHSNVLSVASPHARQHSPIYQSRCLGHHHHDVLGEVGSRHTRSTPSTDRRADNVPSVHSQACGQYSPQRAATADNGARWCCKDLLWGTCYNPFFLLLRQLIFLCPRDLSALVTQRRFSWRLTLQHHAGWPWPSPFLQGLNACTKHLLITYMMVKDWTKCSVTLWCWLWISHFTFCFLEAGS